MTEQNVRRFDWLRLLPQFWLQNYRTDWEWDAVLNTLLDRHDPVWVYKTVRLGNVEVWASNYPYAFGTCYEPKIDRLPSVRTRKRLKAAVDAVTDGNEDDRFRKALLLARKAVPA